MALASGVPWRSARWLGEGALRRRARSVHTSEGKRVMKGSTARMFGNAKAKSSVLSYPFANAMSAKAEGTLHASGMSAKPDLTAVMASR